MGAPNHADHRRADEVNEARARACQARGCPRVWSIDTGGSHLCTAHATAVPHDWPAITERLLWLDAEAARRNAAHPPPEERGPLACALVPPTPDQVAALRAARDAIAERPRGNLVTSRWLELRSRERAGETLTRYQAEAWRAGLRLDGAAAAWTPAWFERDRGEVVDW